MSKIDKAIQVLTTQANEYKAIKEALDFAETLKSLEQLEKEIKARIEKLNKEELEATKRDRSEIQTMLRDAKIEAEKTKQAAKKVLDDAQTQAETLKDKILGELKAEQAALVTAKDDLKATKAEHISVKSSLKTATEELASAQIKLDALKSEIQNTLKKYV